MAAKESAVETRKLQETADSATKVPANDNKKKCKDWSGKYPYLKLIHTLVDNDYTKSMYIHHDNVPSGQMVPENLKTPEVQASSMWQMMANKWNDESFLPVMELCEDLH